MPRFEMNRETRQILDFLFTRPREFTYEQLQQLTGINDISRLRGCLNTCFKRLRKQSVWYGSVRGIGYRLLSEEEKNPVQSNGLAKVRRKAKRIDSDQDTIKIERLSREGKMEFTFNSARIGRLLEATGRKMANEIRRQMKNGEIPLKDER